MLYASTPAAAQTTRERDTLMRFAANPQAGFHFDYLVLLPKGTPIGEASYLMVETNNTGVNDTMAVHEKGARYAASRNGVGVYVAKKMHLPFLVPIFPRPQSRRMVRCESETSSLLFC